MKIGDNFEISLTSKYPITFGFGLGCIFSGVVMAIALWLA
jgi:hypothetical protein